MWQVFARILPAGLEQLSILDMYSWGNVTEQQAMGELGVDHHGLAAMLEAEGMEATEETREALRKAMEALLMRHKTGDVEARKGMFDTTAKTVSIEEMNPLHRRP